MNEIELLTHKISTIMLMLKNNHPIHKYIDIDELRIEDRHGKLSFMFHNANNAGNVNVCIAAFTQANPVQTSPVVYENKEGYLWVNTNDYFFYDLKQDDEVEERIDLIDISTDCSAELFQKSLLYSPRQMHYLKLFSSLYANPLIKGFKFYIKVPDIQAVYDILMQGYSYEV
ncbi:TPA: hypothetical protein OGU99_000587 [Escherichia coli]|nr:hypothetical protein [Escherichia coli O157]USL83418.1 hypothetical protein A4_342 [Escherichia phage A4]HCQ0858661.1 hypothetical protein [Escherichia coli]